MKFALFSRFSKLTKERALELALAHPKVKEYASQHELKTTFDYRTFHKVVLSLHGFNRKGGLTFKEKAELKRQKDAEKAEKLRKREQKIRELKLAEEKKAAKATKS